MPAQMQGDRIMTTAGFKQHQYAFTAHIRDPENNALPSGVEDRRMKIYRELLYNNVEGFIASGFPVIRQLYNDDDWHNMIRDFFANHESHSPYFLEISQEFMNYLENEREPQACDPAGLLELAHYEWVELALHVSDDSIDMDQIDANGNLLTGQPVFSPVAWPLAYQFPVHRMGPDYMPGEPPDQASYLVVYRNRNDEVKFLEVNPVTARLIGLLMEDEHLTGENAIAVIASEMPDVDAGIIRDGGLAELQLMQSLGVILGTRLPG